MYDANPRTHLKRATELVAAAPADDYPKLRYAALDVRLAVETTLQEILSACYLTFEAGFEDLWRANGKKNMPSFIGAIRKQQPDFDLKNRLVPVVLKVKKRILDYPAMDLDRLSSIHHALGGHLHHQSRYDTKKGPNRAAELGRLLGDAISYLSHLLGHPRYWVEFHDSDQKFFTEVVDGKKPLEDFVRHIESGRLKNYAIIDVYHLQEPAEHTPGQRR